MVAFLRVVPLVDQLVEARSVVPLVDLSQLVEAQSVVPWEEWAE